MPLGYGGCQRSDGPSRQMVCRANNHRGVRSPNQLPLVVPRLDYGHYPVAEIVLSCLRGGGIYLALVLRHLPSAF